jgi:hypothetical protein
VDFRRSSSLAGDAISQNPAKSSPVMRIKAAAFAKMRDDRIPADLDLI